MFAALQSSTRFTRLPWSDVAAAIGVAAAVAGLWPYLIAAPVAGGPAAALAAGFCGWRLACAAAPRAHANDNAPRRTGSSAPTGEVG